MAMTSEQVAQLLPCPFCGSIDVRNVSAGYADPSDRFHVGDEIFAVNCYKCGASVPNRYNNDLVVAAWNNQVGIKMNTKIVVFNSAEDARRAIVNIEEAQRVSASDSLRVTAILL